MLTSAIRWERQCVCCVLDDREMALPALSINLCRVLQQLVLLLLLLVTACQSYEIAEVVDGTLTAEETKQYKIEVTGVLVVALVTVEGDADIYASTVVKEPSCHDYQFASTSCGLDLIVVPATKGVESQRVYLSVTGHSRHEHSKYKLVILTPVNDDITKYQVWDWDPETNHQVLLVDYDPLQIANDYTLHLLLGQLSLSQSYITATHSEGAWANIQYFAEWALYLFFETLKIILEILL